MLAQLVPILVPVFIVAGIGYGWARLGQPYDTTFVTRLVTYVGSPCLFFSAITSHGLDLATFGISAGAAVLAIILTALAGAPALWAAGLKVRHFLPSILLPNAGNMGLPITLFAFGEHGLGLAMAFSVVMTVGHFTVGAALMAGVVNLRAMLLNPIIHALVIAVVFLALQAQPPGWLANTTALLGGLTIPMMLMSLGVSLAQMRVGSLGRSAYVSVLRIGLGFAAGHAVVWLLDLDAVMAGVVIIQCVMPAAVYNYLIAALYGGPASDIAGIVVVSTLLSVVTLPLVLLTVL